MGLSCQKSVIVDHNGHPTGLVGVSFDITKRKRQEKELAEAIAKLEQADKLKTEFMNNMEHDIRTPFSAINVFVPGCVTKKIIQKRSKF